MNSRYSSSGSQNRYLPGNGQNQGSAPGGGPYKPTSNYMPQHANGGVGLTRNPNIFVKNAKQLGPDVLGRQNLARRAAQQSWDTAGMEAYGSGGAGGAARRAFAQAMGGTAQEQAALDVLDQAQTRDLQAQGMNLEGWNMSNQHRIAEAGLQNDLLGLLTNRDLGFGQLNLQHQLGNREMTLQDKQFYDNLRESMRQFDEGTRRWDLDFGEDKRRYDQGFAEDTRRWDLGFGEDQRQFDERLSSENRWFDARLGEDRRQFDMGLDQSNRHFYSDLGQRDRHFNSSQRFMMDQMIMQLLAMFGMG